MFYLITNEKTKLSKLVTPWDHKPNEILLIVKFYRNHPTFSIKKLS